LLQPSKVVVLEQCTEKMKRLHVDENFRAPSKDIKCIDSYVESCGDEEAALRSGA
jgi:hypothetical protein